MILLLSEPGTEAAAREIARSIEAEYGASNTPQIVASGVTWDRAVEWDDLLIVVYKSSAFPDASNYIQAYLDAHKVSAPVIPVSTDAANRRPPDPISGIKAVEYDRGPEAARRIVKAAGVFLALALNPTRQKIFISYRASDGAALANAIHDRLKAAGFLPWLDEANDNLQPADDVQTIIRDNIDSAGMLLVVDTPDAPVSKWVKIEIDLAIGQLLTVLPVVAGGERNSRFIQLQSLRRQALVKQDGFDASPLSDEDWAAIHSEIEQVLLLAYSRRQRILTRAQSAFSVQNGFKWQVVDKQLRMYRADKKKPRSQMIALCHCLIHDITYLPALKAYWKYLSTFEDREVLNQRLCIYDRDRELSDAEWDTIAEALPEINLMLANLSELETLAQRL
jgi:hypothetical protein